LSEARSDTGGPTSFPWADPPRPLRFDRFMAAALHDPERGYYARRVRDIGRRGDFTTAAAISPALGRAVGAWAADALAASGCRDLIELGPGDGTLAAAVRASLPWWRRHRTRFHLVERSQPLRELQQQRLGRAARWHADLASALADCGGRACLYSNEFVDAFPARVFRRAGDTWEELHVLPGEARWLAASTLPDSTAFERDWPDGQHLEIHDSYREWLEHELLPHWHAGRMLTIDYGAPVDALHPRRPSGSLRGYFHHQQVDGPELWARPSHQDLTADVNFSDLERWCEGRLRTRSRDPQHRRLAAHLAPDHLGDRAAASPAGAGAAFLWLEQER